MASTAASWPESAEDRRNVLRALIEHCAHLLPAQGPLTVFVHHNTLHAFEEFPFAQALQAGARTFHCHPYWSCERYLREMTCGRIDSADLDAVLREDLGDSADVPLHLLGTRICMRRAMLDRPQRLAPGRELQWIIAETDALRTFDDGVATPVRERMMQATRDWLVRERPDR